MKEIGNQIGNFTVSQVERSTGITTDCVFAVVTKNDYENNCEKKTNVSYDYISGRFVIHEWYYFEEDELEEIKTSVKEFLNTYK